VDYYFLGVDLPDWDFDMENDEIERQNTKVVLMIVTIIIIFGVAIYYIGFANTSSSIISKILPFFGNGENNNGVTINIVSVENLKFKNTSNKISIPLLNLNQPNMFSKFDMRINMIPSSPIPDKNFKFTVNLLQDNNKILTLTKTVSDGFPDYIEFKNITINSTKINDPIKVYVTIDSDSIYINDKYAGTIPYNKIGLGNKITKTTGSKNIETLDDFYIDYTTKSNCDKNFVSDVVTNTNTGRIVLIYPLIHQYSKGVPSFLLTNIKQLFNKWYFSTQTEYTIRNLISAQYTGEHTIYESVNGNIRFDSVEYDNDKQITIKFTPYYDYTIKLPYAETTIYYKIQKVVIGSSAINNYFSITGSDSQIEYMTLHGYLPGDLKSLFKSIHLTVSVYTESGLERNIDFGDFDIVTGKTVLINDEGKAYLYPSENSITIIITNPTVKRIDKVILTLNLNPIENPDKPFITPKYYIKQNNQIVKSDYLPQVKPMNQFSIQPNSKAKIDRYIIVKARDDVQINEIFIPYPALEKDKDSVVNAVTNEVMKSKYIPNNAEDTIKQRISESLNKVKIDNNLKPMIIGAEYVILPVSDGFGFKIMLKTKVRVYGVMLKPEVEFTRVIDDSGNVFYYDIHGFKLNPTEKASMVEDVLVPLKIDDYKDFKLRFTTIGNSSELITITPEKKEVKAYYMDMGHKFHFSLSDGNIIKFSEPIPLSLLPRVEIEESKLPESINMELPIHSKTSGNIFIGVRTSVKNSIMYLHSSTINLYGQGEYLASKSSIELVDNVNNYISVDGSVTKAGVYYVDKSGNFVKSIVLESSGNYIKLTPSTITSIKDTLSNGGNAIVYVFYTDKKNNVYYEELTVNNVKPHIGNMMIVLTNIQSNLKNGGLQFISDNNVRVISGYYTMSVYTGFFNNIKNTKLTISVVFKDNSKSVLFSCTESKCEFKLPKKNWVFDNDKYSVSDTSLTYSNKDGSFIVNIIPIVDSIMNKQVVSYSVDLQFNGDGKDYSAKFTITPQPRQYSVNINPVKTTFLTVSPIVISYSSPFDDLYYYEMKLHEPPIKTILNGVRVKIIKKYQSFGFGNDVVDLIGDKGLTLSELVNSGKFKYEETTYGTLIYPTTIQYDSNNNPHNYKFSKNDIVLFLPIVADYDFSIVSPLLSGQEVLLKATRNYLNFHYYEFTPVKKNIIANQDVTISFIFSIPGFPDSYTKNIADALAKMPISDFKVYLVSSVNTYYECDVKKVEVKKDSGIYYLSVTVKIPSDVPQGTYAFAFTQSGFSLLESPVLSFDELYNDNPLNKFFVSQTLNYATDFLVTTRTVTGAVIWGLNYGILYNDNTAKIDYLPALLISGKQFKLFKLSNDNHYVFRVYSSGRIVINVPVLLHYQSNYQELFYYPQQVYLISVNNPSFKGYLPKDYVKSISVTFDNGMRKIELDYDVQHMYNKLPFDLFAVIDYNGKKLFYLPLSITPYYMIFMPKRAELKVDIELVNGAEITRDIILLPTVVRVKPSGGKYVIDYASTVLYQKGSGGGYFGFSQLNIGSFDSFAVKVIPNSDTISGVYYNIDVPLRVLSTNKIMFNEPEVNDYSKIMFLLTKLSSDANHVKRVDYPGTYSLAGVLEVSYGSGYLYNSIFYMRFDNNIDMNVDITVHQPDLKLIKQWLKSSGWVLKVNNAVFRVMAYTYNDNYYLVVYAKSKSNEAFFQLNLLSIIQGNGAKIIFDGNVYYLVVDSVSYSTGIVNGVMIGVR